MTAQGRKLHFIDFFKQCCLNATRGRDRVVVHPLSFGMQNWLRRNFDALSFCGDQSSLKKIDFPATVHLTSDELEARDLDQGRVIAARTVTSLDAVSMPQTGQSLQVVCH
jgi:hypothetical protein